jgi:K+-sensing histidine kinase KdpD
MQAGGLRRSTTQILLFVLESVLGMIGVVMVAALTEWSRWLLPVAVLLYLLIVVATALLSGFWQAVIVSLSAVGVQAYFAAHQPKAIVAADPVHSVTLVVFVLVAHTVSRLSASVTDNAREAESRGGQMHDLYEFTRRTLQMNLHVEPGPQLAELVHEIFALEAVAVFDADLHTVYQAGYWSVDPQELAQTIRYPASASGLCAWGPCPSAASSCVERRRRWSITPSHR